MLAYRRVQRLEGCHDYLADNGICFHLEQIAGDRSDRQDRGQGERLRGIYHQFKWHLESMCTPTTAFTAFTAVVANRS